MGTGEKRWDEGGESRGGMRVGESRGGMRVGIKVRHALHMVG